MTTESRNTRVLLCNDDGYESPGLDAARSALINAGCKVITVAPAGPRSGTSRSASFRAPVAFQFVGGDDENPIYAVKGTPTDCVRVAVFSGLAQGVGAVVSGINEGANLGDDATYSSTLGAAIEGALLGYPSLAASQQSRDGRFRLVDLTDYDFGWGARVMAGITLKLIEDREKIPARSVLNFNAPTGGASELVVAGLDHRRWDLSPIHSVPMDEGDGWLIFGTHPEQDPVFEHREGSDSWALARGFASVTPLSFAWDNRHARRCLARWTRDAVDELNGKLQTLQ